MFICNWIHNNTMFIKLVKLTDTDNMMSMLNDSWQINNVWFKTTKFQPQLSMEFYF